MEDAYELYQRGMALLEDAHYHQAIVPLAKARDVEPDKTSIREALGRAYFRSGGFEPARAEFEAVVERVPTNDYAPFCLGRAVDAARPDGRGPQAADPGGQHEPEAARLPDLPRPRSQGGLKRPDTALPGKQAFRGRKATFGKRAKSPLFYWTRR